MPGNTGSAFPIAGQCRQNGPRHGRWYLGSVGMDVREPELRIATARGGYLDRALELRPMLAAAGDAIERGREVTPEIVRAMIERGIFKMLLPRSLGGAELDPLTYTAVLESLAQGDGSTAWCLGQNSGCSMIAPYLAPEIGCDSDAVQDHFVPPAYTAGRDSFDELRETGPLYQFTSGMIYAMSFAHVSMGIARGAFDAFIEIARDKVPRGDKGTLRENNVIQSQVSQGEAKLKSARAYLRGVIAEMWDESERTGHIGAEHHPQLRLAATWAIHHARDVVATVYHAAVAGAIFENNPLERRMRDIHAGTQQGQGRPVHFETVGQMLMGLPPEGRMFRELGFHQKFSSGDKWQMGSPDRLVHAVDRATAGGPRACS